jgi:hypothetical protein
VHPRSFFITLRFIYVIHFSFFSLYLSLSYCKIALSNGISAAKLHEKDSKWENVYFKLIPGRLGPVIHILFDCSSKDKVGGWIGIILLAVGENEKNCWIMEGKCKVITL